MMAFELVIPWVDSFDVIDDDNDFLVLDRWVHLLALSFLRRDF